MSFSINRRSWGVIFFTLVLSVLLFSMSWSVFSQTQPPVPQPYLVMDFNVSATNPSSPAYLTNLNGLLYFAATDDDNDTEVWRSDGTISGTFRLKNLRPLSSSDPVSLTVADDLLFFVARTAESYPKRLWVSDGTESGTTPFPDLDNVGGLTAVADTLYFRADDGVHSTELWRSDGTESGTYMVKDINPSGSGTIFNMAQVDDFLYFSGNDGTNGLELWRSDGTVDGTFMVENIHPSGNSSPIYFAGLNGIVYFSATDDVNGRELWRTDGTEAGTFMVSDIVTGMDSGSPTELTAVNNQLFFVSDGELWVSDGTDAGTQLLDFAPSVPSFPTELTVFNNMLYFQADDGVNGVELWRSDGTLGGTTMVQDINLAGFSTPEELTAVGTLLYFQADAGNGSGAELWLTDGTTVGTVQVSDIFPGITGSDPANLTNVNGTLYFAASDDLHGVELWQSSGSDVSTMMVADIADGNGDGYPNFLTQANDTIYVFANDNTQRNLWTTDGTAANTQSVAQIYPDWTSSFPPPIASTPVAESGRPVAIEDKLFYINEESDTGRELWVSDGSPTGTMLLQDIYPGENSGLVGSFMALGDQLLFRARNVSHGYELWISDGTVTNTQMLKDINPGVDSSWPHHLINVDDLVYFRANDAALGDSLWRTDGTEAGTWLVLDIMPDLTTGSDQFVGTMVYGGGQFFLKAYRPEYGYEFWRTDGTTDGTWLLKDIAPGSFSSAGQTYQNYILFNDIFYFSADDNGAYGAELWRSDGTPENTILVKDINEGGGDSVVRQLAVVNGRLFFTATDGIHGRELWISDGTEQGTSMVADINPDGSSVSAHYEIYENFAVLKGLYYFAATDGVHGTELWQSDGTAAGTQMVMDINPGTSSSDPSYFLVVDDTLYFSADDGLHDTELWALQHTTVAQDDYIITRMGQAVNIVFLENDFYNNLDPLEIAIASQSQHGSVVLDGTTFIYTPESGFIGLDSFTYTLTDGVTEPVGATIYVTVEGERLYLPLTLKAYTED